MNSRRHVIAPVLWCALLGASGCTANGPSHALLAQSALSEYCAPTTTRTAVAFATSELQNSSKHDAALHEAASLVGATRGMTLRGFFLVDDEGFATDVVAGGEFRMPEVPDRVVPAGAGRILVVGVELSGDASAGTADGVRLSYDAGGHEGIVTTDVVMRIVAGSEC